MQYIAFPMQPYNIFPSQYNFAIYCICNRTMQYIEFAIQLCNILNLQYNYAIYCICNTTMQYVAFALQLCNTNELSIPLILNNENIIYLLKVKFVKIPFICKIYI